MAARVAMAMAAATMVTGCGGDDGVTIDAAAPIDAAVDAGIDAQGSQCSHQPCSILPQCGCEATPATPVCDLDRNNLLAAATLCRSDMFHGTESTTCSRETTCAAEYACFGRCRHYCDEDADCGGPGGLCIIPVLAGTTPVPGVSICTTSCVPSDASNPRCPAGWACHLYREAGGELRWLTDCESAPATGGALGDACTASNGCQPGLDCFNDGSGMGRRCIANCVCPGGDCNAGTCPSGAGTCHGYTPPAMIGAAVYGRCYI